jgi:hypothetical protein
MIPSLISGRPSWASWAAYRKSQARATSNPPPSANPLIAAIVIFGIASRSRQACSRAPTSEAISSGPYPTIALMSAPAAKIVSPPQTTTAPIASSSATAPRGIGELEGDGPSERVRRRAVDPDRCDRAVGLGAHELTHGGLSSQTTVEPTAREIENVRRALRHPRADPIAWSAVTAGGYTPAHRWVVTLDDGRTVFAKVATDEMTASWLRDEHVVYSVLRGASFMPGYVDSPTTDNPVLVLEDFPPHTAPHPDHAADRGPARRVAEMWSTPPPERTARAADDA